jgi:hypothetical protein
MNPVRSIVWLLVLTASAGGLGAQPVATVPAGAGPAPTEAAAEEVYVPERAGAPSPPAPAAPAPTNAPVAPAPTAASPATDKNTPTITAKTPATSAPTLTPRFQQVRDRISALLGHRNDAPPVADPRKNPFRPAGAAPAAPVKGRPTGTPVVNPPVKAVTSGTDYQMLQAAAATLKVSGTIQINGLGHLIINQVPYKEGDVLKARVNGNSVFVRVKHISRYSYTLALNNAELSVKY